MNIKKRLIALTSVAVLCSVMLSGCVKNEYQEAGENFKSWINTDPDTWSDAEKQYYNDFMDWVDKQ